MKKPVEVATWHTVSFIVQHISPGARILEIGSGEGQVALALQNLDYQARGLDADAETVALAKRHGAFVEQARWPDYETSKVDAVVFTRSLHHIDPLGPAITKTGEALASGGLLMVEDFAFDQADNATIDWFLNILRSPPLRDSIEPSKSTLISGLIEAKNPYDEWRKSHDHDLHSIDAMSSVIGSHFSIHHQISVPYLYRYLIPVLPESPPAVALTKDVYDKEQRAIAAGNIIPVGRRIVASLF